MRDLYKLLSIGVLMSGLIACGKSPYSTGAEPAGIEATNLSMETTIVPTVTPGKLGSLLASPLMISERAAHSATLLQNGSVLLTGGFAQNEQALATAELFDPQTQTFSSIDSMSEPRQSHTATLLPNGMVLLSGGFNGDYLASAELFDPATGAFLPTGHMTVPRSGHIAVLMDNGLVLIAGGTSTGWTFLSSAELYDLKTGTFFATKDMTVPRESHTATLLKNGQVLITGGHQGRRANITIYASTELYDPRKETFTATGEMTIRRHKHEATLLADGRVFISGGADERDTHGAYRSTEIYHPLTGTFAPAADMHQTRYKHTGTSILLENGQVLILGGATSPEIFDPQTGKMQQIVGSNQSPRYFARATLLANGDILFSGGYGQNIHADRQAWILASPIN